MCSIHAVEQQVRALEQAVDELLALDPEHIPGKELAGLLPRIESRARNLAALSARWRSAGR